MTQRKWNGIYKLFEEMGELTVELGKVGAFPASPHPDGKGDLKARIEEEVGDVYAALDYFVKVNELDSGYIDQRRRLKLGKYQFWGLTGIGDYDVQD